MRWVSNGLEILQQNWILFDSLFQLVIIINGLRDLLSASAI